MKGAGHRSIAVDRRLASRMVFLLVTTLLGGLLLVFHVRDMENRPMRRDLQGPAESLTITLGPEQIDHLKGAVNTFPNPVAMAPLQELERLSKAARLDEGSEQGDFSTL
jgi:hypothetical protein